MKSYFIFMFALWMGGVTVICIQGCEKSRAEAPRVLAAVSTCSDTSGIYSPVAISTFNAGTVTLNTAHFTQVCSEVYVSGTLSGTNAFDTLQSSIIQVSLPVASNLTMPPQNESGMALIGFFGAPQPLMGSIGFVHLVGQTGAVINWHLTKKSNYSMIYNFSYTVK